MASFSITGVIREARRRRVFRLVGLYIVGAWVFVQIALAAFPAFGIPDTAIRYVWIGVAIGLPIAVFLGWRYDIRSGRIVRTVSGVAGPDLSVSRIDIAVLGALSIVVVIVVSGLFGEVTNTREPVEADRLLPEISPNSIAVMPFVNMSEDPDNEFFADGIAEELLNLLAKIRELQVTSRSSAFSLKGQNLDVPTIATRLNVAHVLEGSVRVHGDQVRITAQLIAADTDTHLWSETYDRNFDDIFAIQDEVAQSVADAMQATLLENPTESRKADPEAYALMLQVEQGTHNDLDAYESLVRQALEIDPNYARAWTVLASIHMARPQENQGTFLESLELARLAVERAIEVDPAYAPAYDVLSRIHYQFDWDFEAAYEAIEIALELEPGNFSVMGAAMDLEIMLGNFDSAIEIGRRRLAIDPLRGHHYLARALFHAGHIDEAIAHFRMALSLHPGSWGNNIWLVFVYLSLGDVPAAAAEAELVGEQPFRDHVTTLVLYAQGKTDEADALFQKLQDDFGDNGAYFHASICAFRDDSDCAFEWLDTAYEVRADGLKHLKSDAFFVRYHDDPRWGAFMGRMGLPR